MQASTHFFDSQSRIFCNQRQHAGILIVQTGSKVLHGTVAFQYSQVLAAFGVACFNYPCCLRYSNPLLLFSTVVLLVTSPRCQLRSALAPIDWTAAPSKLPFGAIVQHLRCCFTCRATCEPPLPRWTKHPRWYSSGSVDTSSLYKWYIHHLHFSLNTQCFLSCKVPLN